jgi:magnesium-transporting ATPase (P-type)
MAYAGCSVINGRGKGIVVNTGKNTELGKIAENVLNTEDTKSPLVMKMEKFSKQISIAFIVFAAFLAMVLYLKNYEIKEIFSVVVALTISAIPEGLTIAMTIVLSIASTKMAKRNVIIKKLNSVESLGSCTVIATDKTGTLTANEQTAKKIILPNKKEAYVRGIGYNDVGEIKSDDNISKEIKEICMMGVINNEATLKFENGKWTHLGDAIDTAFLALGMKAEVKDTPDVNYKIVYEPELKYSAVFFEDKNEVYVTAKGAPDKIIEFCEYMDIDGKDEKIDKTIIMAQNNSLANEGYRVIGIARLRNSVLNKKQEYNESDINKLTFLGLIGFIDPIRDGVEDAARMCKNAGIKTIMITGDQKNTAEAIGKKINISKIYSRVTPMEKLEIVNNLKAEGELVAVTGDGVNDVPALKAANIGVAMGSGTDIAKETGNMIITDDNFSTIVKGVEEGRKAYNNIRKVIYLLLSTGFSEIILFVFSIIFNLPIPLTAIQLLWLNLITNGIQGDALAFEKDDESVLNEKVKKQTIFDKLMIKEIVISSIVMAAIEFIFYVYLLKIRKTEIILARSYLLTLMVFMENIQIFNCRSEKKSVFKVPGENNRFLIISIILTLCIQTLIVRVPELSGFFGLRTIEMTKIGALFLLTIPIIIVMEIFKKTRNVNIL